MAQSVFSGDAVSRSVGLYTAMPHDIIVIPELSGRKDYSNLEALEIPKLAADIVARGQDTPGLCRKSDAGKPVLVYGRRRLMAVEYANQHLVSKGNEIEFQFKYEKLTDTDALIAAIQENSNRKDVNDMDHAFNIEQLIKRCKMSLEKIAAIYFPDAQDDHGKANAVRWVRERAGLVELAPEAQAKVRTGEMKITTAKDVAKLSHNDQRELLKQPAKVVAGKARITVQQVKAVKAASKPASSKPKPHAAAKVDDSVPFDAPVAAPVPAPLPTNPVLAAAEKLARAVDRWMTDATDKAEKALIAAHKEYRALVPLKLAEGKAA